MKQTPRIESCGPLELIGVALFGNPAKVRFHDAWVLFGQLADEAGISRIGRTLYGLQLYPPSFPATFEFTYFASIEKTPDLKVPLAMLTKTLPRCSYVVQRIVGGVDGIDPALRYLYKDYLLNNGLKVAFPFDFEKYLNVNRQDSSDGEIEVWIPIRQSG
jgi:predicted transcriptional regulator YdeE